jgi:hypothetical protein
MVLFGVVETKKKTIQNTAIKPIQILSQDSSYLFMNKEREL